MTDRIPSPRRGAPLALILAACCLLGAIFGTASALAAYGDKYELADAQGAIPGPKAFWAGTCDLSAAPPPTAPIPGGYGSRPAQMTMEAGSTFAPPVVGPSPLVPRDCIDPGVTEPIATANPWREAPAWRLPPETGAGAHPDGTAMATITRDDSGTNSLAYPAGSTQNVKVDLPPGLVGNPEAVPLCTAEQFDKNPPGCPAASQVGIADIRINFSISVPSIIVPVYRIEPRPGAAAEFGIPSVSITSIRVQANTRSDGDFGLTTFVADIPTGAPFLQQSLTFWGVPWASSHDPYRIEPGTAIDWADGGGIPANGLPIAQQAKYEGSWGEIQPFLSNPTRCNGEEPTTDVRINTWQFPEKVLNYTAAAPAITDCDRLGFEPEISVTAATAEASTPTAVEVDLRIPQHNQAPLLLRDKPDDKTGAPAYFKSDKGLATPHLKDTVVTLPEGMTLTPGAATGLAACSTAQMGLMGTNFPDPNPIRFDKTPVGCPAASKLGTVSVQTPLLPDPLDGEIYMAAQDDNPFNSTYAIYLNPHSEKLGLNIKLAGKVEADPVTGQLKSTFTNNPQLPFEHFKLRFKGGSRAPLVNPATCGPKTTIASLASWAAPTVPEQPTDQLTIDSGPGGGACVGSDAAREFNLGLDAGAANPVAGASSPFNLRITRPDGSQDLESLTLRPPKGFLAVLKGVPYCPESAIAAASAKTGKEEQSSPSCPAASQVGTVQTGAGAGATPYYAGGKLYLAGPYKGAPLSAVAVTPAVAGPFDLGNVVVRSAISVDPVTAQITATTDPIPTILKGVPLAIGDLRINLDRPGWAMNPTNCTPTSVDVQVRGSAGSVSNLSNRFQVGSCSSLGFQPKLALSLKGPTHRSAFPRLRAVLTPRPGDANIGRAQVTLPKTQFLEQSHIRTVCTRVQYAASACPAASIYGYARAWSPVLEEPLQGPVYLRSSDNTLPDLVASLDGQIHVDLVGRIDSFKARIRNTFETVPDAPVSRFELVMQGGKKGLLVNNTELCKTTARALARFAGQNGKVQVTKPVVKVDCGKKGQKQKRR